MASEGTPGPGSAPRARSRPKATATDLVASLDATFREQVRRALQVELDGSIESLAFVDHYVRLAQDEVREPIVSLLAAGAGAYFGQLVVEHIGGTWIGDGRDPRRLRVLLSPQFVHFSPVDQAYEAIASRALSPDDPRIADGPPFDPSFQLRPPRPEPDTDTDANSDSDDRDDDTQPDDDADWLGERLAELAPLPEDQFHSLTCRFETLQHMLELLAAKHAAEGKGPRTLSLADYMEAVGRV